MKVLDARFVTSAVDAQGIPNDGIPHVAFVGRSNVGKSSLLNALVKRDLARTSAAAGKTRLANLYKVVVEGGPGGPGQWSVYFADLPGYGYARGGRQSVAELRRIAEAYFEAGLNADGKAGLKACATADKADVAQGFSPARRDDAQADVAQGFSPAPRTGPIVGVLHLVDARHPGLDADLDAARWLATLDLARGVLATKIDKLSRGERVRNLRELERQLGTAALPISAASGEGLDDLWKLIARLISTNRKN